MSHDNHPHAGSANGGTIDPHDLGHIVPYKMYLRVFLTLIGLTVLTVVIAQIHFSTAGNIIVAMLVASVKATLVAMYFMHLKYENPVTWTYAAFPIILLGLLIGGLFIDNPYRTDTKPVKIEGAVSVVVKDKTH